MNFAKLFQISEDNQVLFTCDYDVKTEEHQVGIRTDFEGVVSVMKVNMESEAAALEFITKCEERHALEFRKLLKAFLEQEKAKLN